MCQPHPRGPRLSAPAGEEKLDVFEEAWLSFHADHSRERVIRASRPARGGSVAIDLALSLTTPLRRREHLPQA